MRSYIENHQFYYVNTDIESVSLKANNISEYDFEYVGNKILGMKDNVEDSVKFLEDSFAEIESELSKWHSSYLSKVENIKNTNKLIMMGNISPDDNGFFSLMEIDYSGSSNMAYSKADSGIVLSSVNELYIGNK